MGFSTYEESSYLGEPVTLLKFTHGSTVMGYTDATKTVVYASRSYSPLPLDHDALNATGTMDKTTLRIRVPSDSAIAELFRVYPPSSVVGVTIYHGHANDPSNEFKAVFVGRVLAGNRADDSITTLVCEPISRSFMRPGLRRRYQRLCPHALYNSLCGVNKATFTKTGTVDAILTPELRFMIASGWSGALAPSIFINGIFSITVSGETIIRPITSVDAANIITVGGKLPNVTIGSTVQLIPGCDHTMETCKNVFNNVLNFGGQPWIPTTNPLAAVNNFD